MPPTHPVQLGRYEILEEIGRGAMGLVYLAKDPLIGRLVALKTLRLLRMTEDEEIEQFRRRFIREAQSAGILSHPNIVTIHDVVDEPGEGGATFIAMEYIRGTDLKQLILEQGALDLRFIVDVVRRVASALDYAHSRGVVHRDVKPANVLITGEGGVKITDFGIARLNTSNLTLEHELLGTPNYMAPEQILGTDADHRADIFSLGVLLYEMLTGQKPFTGDNLTSVTHNIVYEPFTPPDEHVSHLPPGIGDILTKALAKKPEDRYASAGELATALAEVVKAYEKESSLNETRQLSVGPLVPAKQGGSWRTSRMWRSATRRPPVLRSIAVAGIAALVVLLLSAWWVERLSERHEVPPDQVFAQERLAQYLDLLREGRENLEGGDPVGAVESLRRAERLAPERPEARALREQAEIEADSLSEVQRQVSTLLRQARDAIREQQFTEAVIATDAALALAPGQEVATQLRDIAIDLRRDQLREAERRRLAAKPLVDCRFGTGVRYRVPHPFVTR